MIITSRFFAKLKSVLRRLYSSLFPLPSSLPLAGAALFGMCGAAGAQQYRPDPKPGEQGSRNIHVIGHLPLTVSSPYNIADIEIEQELSRPYIYISHPNEAQS